MGSSDQKSVRWQSVLICDRLEIKTRVFKDATYGMNSAMEAMDEIYGHNGDNLNVLE